MPLLVSCLSWRSVVIRDKRHHLLSLLILKADTKYEISLQDWSAAQCTPLCKQVSRKAQKNKFRSKKLHTRYQSAKMSEYNTSKDYYYSLSVWGTNEKIVISLWFLHTAGPVVENACCICKRLCSVNPLHSLLLKWTEVDVELKMQTLFKMK